MKVGMQEQAAIALADIAHKNAEMQGGIVDAGGVPPLLQFIRTGSPLGQEHAARAIWHLAALTEVQSVIVEAGAIPELVQLLKTGSPKAQEMAAAGLSDLAQGAVAERLTKQAATAAHNKAQVEAADRNRVKAENRSAKRAAVAKANAEGGTTAAMEDEAGASGDDAEVVEDEDEEESENDGLVAIAEAGGIMPLVSLLTSGTVQARENAAGALWHLALDRTNQIAIARANGISPLVTILDDGTEQAHKHSSDALSRLAIKNPDNQAQIAKHCVALLGNPATGTQRRAAQALRDLAANNPGSPVVIVNAGAISPLVTLLSSGAPDVKEKAADALSTLAFNSPSTQLAIASGLVVLVGTGAAESQEHVTMLLLTLARDADNCVAITRAGAIPRLVVQLRGGGRTSVKAQELATAVLSHLSVSEDGIKAIAASGCIRPLVTMLASGTQMAQAHAAAVLAEMARTSTRSQNQIHSEGAISPLVSILAKESIGPKAKAEAAGALLCLSSGQPDTQKAVSDAGAIKWLVALLNEEDETARRKAAGAIAALCVDSTANQDKVEQNKGIPRLVGLLAPGIPDAVSAEAAAALAVLSRSNKTNQDKVAAAGGIFPLVALLQGNSAERAKEEASAALWSLSSQHYDNQVAVADAGGIAPLVAVLGLTSVRAQEQAAGALASLALDNTANEGSIAQLIVSLLGSDDKQASAKAALAVSRLARANASNQRSIANAGGVSLLVNLLDTTEGGVGVGPLTGQAAVEALEAAKVQREMASALWSMCINSPDNQAAIEKAGGITPLVALLDGHGEVQRDAAGALWALSASADNQMQIAAKGGIAPLVSLLRSGNGAQETAAGALHALAETAENRIEIASAGGIPLLVSLFDSVSEMAVEEVRRPVAALATSNLLCLATYLTDSLPLLMIWQASGALIALATQNVPNQLAVAHEAVSMLKLGSAMAQERITALVRGLAQDPENRSAIAKAGAVPELVSQLETGSERAMGMAASALALIALKSAEHRATVTQELVKLLGSNKEAVRQRASEALTDMSMDDTAQGKGKSKSSSLKDGVPLVNLLKDGLKDGCAQLAYAFVLCVMCLDGRHSPVLAPCPQPVCDRRVEAQEYALRSLLSISDTASREAIVEAGCIKPLIAALTGRKISSVAQEHAAAVLSGLAPLGTNAATIMEAKGIEPLVLLLSEGNNDAKEHAADALAQLALRAEASNEIAKAGAVSAFVKCAPAPDVLVLVRIKHTRW